MKKKLLKVTLISILLFSFSSCDLKKINDLEKVEQKEISEQKENFENKEDTYEKIHKILLSIEDYEAIAEVKYISNKNENTYLTRQKAKKDGKYKIEVIGPEEISGTVTIYDGDVIYQHNPKNSGEVYMATEDTKERSELFLTTFIENYEKSLSSAVAVGNFGEDGSKTTVFETNIPGGNSYINNEVLTFDNETLMPLTLIIKDEKGKDRIIITYKEFTYNLGISDMEFKIDK